jgi:hypothetical protein
VRAVVPKTWSGRVNALNAGTLTPQAVATDIARSPEGLGVLVDGLYQKILLRNSDATGRAAFVR